MERVVLFVVSVMLGAALPVQAQGEKCETNTLFIEAADKFVAADHFIVNNSRLGIIPSFVKISNLGNGGMPDDNFERFLLNTTELNLPYTELCGFFVPELSADFIFTSIIDDWGPLSLYDMWRVLARQPNGERGLLLTNGGLNYFHISGTDGKVWILLVRWPDDRGWSISAVTTQSLSTPYALHRGSLVISPRPGRF